MMLDEIKCVTLIPVAHMPIRIAKRCTYFCLLSISDGALGRKRRGKCWWSDERDKYEYFVVLNEIFAYASIEIFR